MSKSKHIAPILCAMLIALPSLYVRFAHIAMTPPAHALISGFAILGASFLLLWACDAAQADISQALALAVVALIAVLPEYAVDMYFTWQAGKHPHGDYAQFAIANMTGANRLLIGGAWTLIAVICWLRTRRPVQLEKERTTELFFLGIASLYAVTIPIKGTLNWFDGLVFLGIYAWYIHIAAQRPCGECESEGPADLLVQMSQLPRRLATISMFAFAATVIGVNAAPFSEGLVGTGALMHVDRFLLVQWLAPIASEAPEFIVAVMFALRGRAGLALGSLLCAKLNQWTLLVGMIPGAFAISSGSMAHPIPMNSFQMHEILLTAAQSVLAIVILARMRLTIGHAALLCTLFVGQLVSPQLLAGYLPGDRAHQLFSALYFLIAIGMLMVKRHRLQELPQGIR